jgi:glucose-6-phosphate dehydrogenase assembly protein OpcA
VTVGATGGAAAPTLRWRSRARTIEGIEQELARIWSQPDLTTTVDGSPGRHVAARTSVMNLVVVARRPEIAERCAATIQALTGRHPSRTLIVSPADPDGPSWLDAHIQAHCVLPREDAPEVCAETIFLSCGGESGRHLGAIIAPLLIHDLPVTVWWPGDPPFGSPAAHELLGMADRLVVDGSSWSESGLARLGSLARLLADQRLSIFDIALVRQARWREAIASVFDMPAFLPYLRSLRRIAVTYATHDETGDPTATNIVKPVYHVAWLASRLDLSVVRPLEAVPPPKRQPGPRGFAATLRDGRSQVAVVVRPVTSPMPGGTTLRVELLAERRGSELRADVTAEAETVRVHVWQDGVQALDRAFQAPRRTDVDLLAEAIEAGGADPVGHDALRAAGALVGSAATR